MEHLLIDSSMIINSIGTSLVVQWVRLRAPSAGGPSSIPVQGTRSHVPQLRVRMLQLKILHAATKIPHARSEERRVGKEV